MRVQMIPTGKLSPNPRNARVHSKKQIQKLANSIKAFGFVVPILADDDLKVIAGHGRLAAANLLELQQVPVIQVSGLSEARKRALAIADNQIAAIAHWDRQQLGLELQGLAELLKQEQLEVDITGFEPAEIEAIQIDLEDAGLDPSDDLPKALLGTGVCRPGDQWLLDRHKLACGDARNQETLGELLQGELAAAAFLDPPFNTPAAMIGGRGRNKHPDFAMAHGELSSEEFKSFLTSSLAAATAVSRDGAVHFICMDWRSIADLVCVGKDIYGAYLNLVVWDKANAGQGSFYRSQHELIAVFRTGTGSHLNNIQLGRFGRNRSNIWRYPGSNGFRSDRDRDLQAHPTVKPTQMVVDALKDCTRRGDIVLDTFAGSGTIILAAERTGRRARAVELEPRFVDTAIQRWQEFTGKDALHIGSGLTFSEMSEGQRS